MAARPGPLDLQARPGPLDLQARPGPESPVEIFFSLDCLFYSPYAFAVLSVHLFWSFIQNPVEKRLRKTLPGKKSCSGIYNLSIYQINIKIKNLISEKNAKNILNSLIYPGF
jgi:hypothetical protein